MAGTFTHFMVCDASKANRKALSPDLRKLLNSHAEFLFLGAASPDLPYLSFKTGNVNWADVMHYETTNAIAVIAQVLKKVWGSRGVREEVQLVWLLGFVSHLVTDATIHPIVQAIVGSPRSLLPRWIRSYVYGNHRLLLLKIPRTLRLAPFSCTSSAISRGLPQKDSTNDFRR